MALGVILVAQKHLAAAGGRLDLVVATPEIRRIFEITMLDQVLDLHDTRAEAIDGDREKLERVVQRRMNPDQRVDPGDLEQPEDAGVARDHAEGPIGLGERSSRADEGADAGRVEERAPRQVDHDHVCRQRRERLVEARSRRQVELARDEYGFHTSGQRFAPNVKIPRRDHSRRV